MLQPISSGANLRDRPVPGDYGKDEREAIAARHHQSLWQVAGQGRRCRRHSGRNLDKDAPALARWRLRPCLARYGGPDVEHSWNPQGTPHHLLRPAARIRLDVDRDIRPWWQVSP